MLGPWLCEIDDDVASVRVEAAAPALLCGTAFVAAVVGAAASAVRVGRAVWMIRRTEASVEARVAAVTEAEGPHQIKFQKRAAHE